MPDTDFRPLTSVSGLRELGPGVRIVDTRFVLGDTTAGEREYLDGHVPGAAFMDVDRDLSAPPGDRGRHPLPDPDDCGASARASGISARDTVVAYDEAGEGGAVRLWWLLRHLGHERVSVLDGGLAAWREAGGELAAGREAIARGDFGPRVREGDVAELDEVEAVAAAGCLIDARATARFRGDEEPIDPVAGHIPGARSLPFGEIAPGGRFLADGELGRRLGPEPVVAYCGSGITACTLVLAAELAGIEARLYPGGWSEWSRAGRAAERG